MASSPELFDALAEKLNVASFEDASNNGLQMASRKKAIAKVCTGVDATLPFFREAVRRGADLVVCHHGISWGDSLKRIDGLNYEIVSFLVEHDLALWACHLPLDAHPALGNNAQICASLGLSDLKPFGEYHGQTIGFKGEFASPIPRAAFLALVREKISPRVTAHEFGPREIRTVGVVSGGASSMLGEALDCGLDAFVDGETDLAAYNLCLQRGGNLYAAGHYATERFGVRAVGDWLARRFGIAHEFIDFDIPL